MKIRSLVLLSISSLLIAGCSFNPGRSLPSSSEIPTTTSSPTTSGSLMPSSTGMSSSSIPVSSSITSIPTTSSGKDLENLEINLTALNDFHGYIDEVPEQGYVGLAKLSTYLKDRKSQGDILINSGDSYQGTFVSNYTKGGIISEIFKDIGFDAVTLGNHEFDWGKDTIRYNEQIFGQRFLGANIYNYPKESEWVKSELGDLYRVVTLNEHTDAEIKVGIIGVIGRDQITSITSLFVQNEIFLDPVPIIKSLSDELRAAGCDVVVADFHSADIESSLGSVSSVSGKKYVDAVFAAHTHQFETYTIENDVAVVQAGENGEAVGRISLHFNKLTGEVSTTSYSTISLAGEFLSSDPEAKAKIDEVEKETSSIGNKVVGSASRYISRDNMSRFYAKIAAEKAAEMGYSVDYVMFNSSRESLSSGNFTYEQLFATHPFKNDLYILSCTEANISDEMSYGTYGYNVCGESPSSSTTSYKNVLVYNYNGFHQAVNSNYEKYYNYFPTAFTYKALHEPTLLPGVNVFDLSLEWLEIHSSISQSDYSGSNFF